MEETYDPEKDRRWFMREGEEAMKDALAEWKSCYALIRDREVRGTFETFNEAADEGERLYGPGNYLVETVTYRPVVGSEMNMLLRSLEERISKARERHPKFAEGQWQALGYLEEEMGEVAREITKGKPGWEGRMADELLDLMTVASRMWLREW